MEEILLALMQFSLGIIFKILHKNILFPKLTTNSSKNY